MTRYGIYVRISFLEVSPPLYVGTKRISFVCISSLYIFIRYHVEKMSVSWLIASRIPEATEFVDDDL